MKYDCNRTLDYVHELKRMCGGFTSCRGCLIDGMGCSRPTQEIINIVQKWSDRNPELPKLTQKERAFIGSFVIHSDKKIERSSEDDLYITDISGHEITISHDMFTFIGEGESMTFSSLYKLEVESEDE